MSEIFDEQAERCENALIGTLEKYYKYSAIGTVKEFIALKESEGKLDIEKTYLRSKLAAYKQAEEEGRILPDCKKCKLYEKDDKKYDIRYEFGGMYRCRNCIANRRKNWQINFEPTAKEDKG